MQRTFKYEDQLQAACVEYWQPYRFTSVLYSVPNGGNREPAEAKKLKATGTMAGVFDLTLLLPGGKTVFIEMKNGHQEKLRDNQVLFQSKVARLGFANYVCYTYIEFTTLIDTLLAPYFDTITGTVKPAGVQLIPKPVKI